jgi:Xaa-Pro aminopeptidase
LIQNARWRRSSQALENGGAKVDAVRDPVVLAKAIKNSTEIAGHDAAQLRDNAALVRFLHWIKRRRTEGKRDGTLGRREAALLPRGDGMPAGPLSFDTISGAGPNGAIVHYRAEEKTNRIIAPDMLYLVDSGGQYRDGTTDITRTIAIGTPSKRCASASPSF